MTSRAPEYLFDPRDKPALPWHEVPLIVADADSLAGYGCLVDDPDKFEIEIVTWPAQGWRAIDPGTGDEGGIAEGVFHSEWQGNVLIGSNDAVDGHYVLGWSEPGHVTTSQSGNPDPTSVLLWHMNYHPDGGQLFYPLDKAPFVVPLALPGDDLQPDQIVAFWCSGEQGLYIHPNIWHEGVFPISGSQRFLDRQGKVHARVSCDLGEEFGVYLAVPLTRS